jgi:nucleosome binding factor SPN SPT16 subunit
LKEEEINARVEELDALVGQLQKRKQELLETKRAMDVTKILASLQWKPFKGGKDGEWTFLTDPQGNLIKELEPVKSFVESLSKDKRVVEGEYGYNISENKKFLHRFSAKTSPQRPK